MENFPSRHIVELGPGYYSTPIFYNHYGKRFTAIEDDPKWFEILRERYAKKPKFNMFLSGMILQKKENGGIRGFNELDDSEKAFITGYYRDLIRKLVDIDIAFVDQIKYARLISIQQFFPKEDPKTKVLIYHDAEVPGRYGYSKIKHTFRPKRHLHFTYRISKYKTNMLVDRKYMCSEKELEKSINRYNKIFTSFLEYNFKNLYQLLCDFSFNRTRPVDREWINNEDN